MKDRSLTGVNSEIGIGTDMTEAEVKIKVRELRKW